MKSRFNQRFHKVDVDERELTMMISPIVVLAASQPGTGTVASCATTKSRSLRRAWQMAKN